MPREFTNKLLQMVEEGLLDKDTVIMACVKYMSEDEVKDMMHVNEFSLDEDEDQPEHLSSPNGCLEGCPACEEEE